MPVIVGSPLDLLAQQFAAVERTGYAETLFESDTVRVLSTANGIAHRFAVQTATGDVDYPWQIEAWLDSPVAAAMWALI